MEQMKETKWTAIWALCERVTLIFAALRACDVIAWEWWWVLSPLLIALLLVGAALLMAIPLAILASGYERDES